MFDFGLKLRELRISKNLTQKQVAQRLNLTDSTISGYENNLKTPSIDVLSNLALLFGVSMDYLSGIDHRRMICIDDLTPSQEELINLMVAEFRKRK